MADKFEGHAVPKGPTDPARLELRDVALPTPGNTPRTHVDLDRQIGAMCEKLRREALLDGEK